MTGDLRFADNEPDTVRTGGEGLTGSRKVGTCRTGDAGERAGSGAAEGSRLVASKPDAYFDMVDGPGEVERDLDSDAEDDSAGLKGPGLAARTLPFDTWVVGVLPLAA